jgi:adenylyltransferase/sulfurtransferase
MEEKDFIRYQRQIVLPEMGDTGQLKLQHAKVLVIGAGGLGCPVLQYLTAAGVGQIGIVDFDLVNLHNLHRQILFNESSIGKNKAHEAASVIKKINSKMSVEIFDVVFNNINATDIISQYDIVVDCSDNFETRYLINDVCVLLNKPFVFGAIYRFEGQITVFNFRNGPTYRCLFPQNNHTEIKCDEAGVIGVLPGIIGVLQATEVIKIITEIGEVLSGKLLLCDLKTMNFQHIKIERNENLWKNLMPSSVEELMQSDYKINCETENNIEEIYADDLDFFLQSSKSYIIIDVREPLEQPKLNMDSILEIPLQELENKGSDIPLADNIIFICEKGNRSKTAASIFFKKNYDKKVFTLAHGIASLPQHLVRKK